MNVVYAVLLCLALAVIELFIGGTRLLFSVPAYGILAVAALASLVDLRRSKLPPSGWCLLSSALFFGYLLVRALVSPVVYLAWPDEFAILGALIVYLLTACYLTDPRRRLWVLAGLLVLAGVNLYVGARQFAEGGNYMLFGFRRAVQYTGRASGLYICPDHLAGYLEVVTCLSVAMVLWSRCRAWVKLLIGYGALCCVAGLLTTASRGGALSFCAGVGVLTVLGLWRAGTSGTGFLRGLLAVLFALAVLVGGVAAALSYSPTLQDRARILLDKKDIRLRMWPAAIRQFDEARTFGTGSGTYLYYGRKYRDESVQADPIRPHNDYLELLAEYGVVGAAGFLLFLGAHLRWGWRAFRHLSLSSGGGGGSNAAAWNIGALAAVACLVVHSMVDFNLHIPANALLLAFVFGVLANPGRGLPSAGPSVQSGTRPGWPELLPRLALPALGVWILAVALPKLPGAYFAEQARVALRDNRSAAALNFARQGLAYEHQDPILYGYLGEARLNLAGNGPDTPFARSFREAAVQAYTAAIQLSPQDSYLLVRLGEAYTRLRDFDAADRTFRQALQWDPNSGYVLTLYGFYLLNRGDLTAAEAAYRRGHALSPYAAADNGLSEIARLKAAAGNGGN